MEMSIEQLRLYFLTEFEGSAITFENLNEGINVNSNGFKQYQLQCDVETVYHFYFAYVKYVTTSPMLTHSLKMRFRNPYSSGVAFNVDIRLATDIEVQAAIHQLFKDIVDLISIEVKRARIFNTWNEVALKGVMPTHIIRPYIIDEFTENNK